MIEFFLKENVNGTVYEVEINSTDDTTFRVVENGGPTKYYDSREDFLKDFGELEEWFWEAGGE